MILLALALFASQSAAAAAPAAAAATCTANLPSALAAWRDAHPVAHGFVVGRAVDLPVVPIANVRLAVQPSRPLSGSHLATGSFEVKTAGTYRIAVGGTQAPIRPLWLDVAGPDGKPLTSVAHGHGAPCSSITKVVDFDLKPGRYTFLATGLAAATPVRALIVPKR